jgi:hypothetical protein
MHIKGLVGAEAFLRLLSGMAVKCIFASPGSEWAPVWEFLANPELKNKPVYLSSDTRRSRWRWPAGSSLSLRHGALSRNLVQRAVAEAAGHGGGNSRVYCCERVAIEGEGITRCSSDEETWRRRSCMHDPRRQHALRCRRASPSFRTHAAAERAEVMRRAATGHCPAENQHRPCCSGRRPRP